MNGRNPEIKKVPVFHKPRFSKKAFKKGRLKKTLVISMFVSVVRTEQFLHAYDSVYDVIKSDYFYFIFRLGTSIVAMAKKVEALPIFFARQYK